MQAIFLGNEDRVNAFRETLSEARFSRYIRQAGGDPFYAIDLYHWNALLSQSLYIPLQTWEVALRNRLNQFLVWKYGQSWPYSDVFNRNIRGNERNRLLEARKRQQDSRRVDVAPTGAIVADLSAGFWVALLKEKYDTQFAWRHNIRRVLPHAERPDREAAYEASDALLNLRNRVAHHEPVLHLDLPALHTQVMSAISGMCPAAAAYSVAACRFRETWALRPVIPANDLDPG